MSQLVVDEDRPDLGGNIRHGDRNTHSPALWRYLTERFGVSSMLDVGCGEGHTVKFFYRLGCYAHGIDGLATNVSRAVIPISLHDLTKSAFIMPVDLVWSCEVAEHLPDNTVDYYLDTLANGNIIAMTHAIPGQVGHHHINCQPKEYWIAKLALKGFLLDYAYEDYRRIAAVDSTHNFFSQSGLVFFRG